MARRATEHHSIEAWQDLAQDGSREPAVADDAARRGVEEWLYF